MTRESHSNKRNGAYYTPEGVAALLVRAAVRSPGDRLLDPACGDGRFLAHHPNSTGVERDGSAARAARQRVPAANVYNDGFFSWARRAHQSGERFDCVAGTTNAKRPPTRSRLAAPTRNGAQEAAKPENATPSSSHSASAARRVAPLNVW